MNTTTPSQDKPRRVIRPLLRRKAVGQKATQFYEAFINDTDEALAEGDTFDEATDSPAVSDPPPDNAPQASRAFARFLRRVEQPASDDAADDADSVDLSQLADEPVSPPTKPDLTVGQALEGTVTEERSGLASQPTIYATALSVPDINSVKLTEATAKLAKLPTEVVPHVGLLPTGSRMPFEPNPFFLGRDAELLDLARKIKTERTVIINQQDTVIQNQRAHLTSDYGGIGKTQLASEFVHRYGQYFAGGVYWLNFSNPTTIAAEIIAIGSSLASDIQPDFRNLLLEEQLQLVLSAWQSALPRLLIFDNCEDPDLLTRWLPTQGGCRVIVTSRQSHWTHAANQQVVRLKPLSRAHSVDLLKMYRPDPLASLDDLNSLAAEVGDMPLALRLAGNFLMTYRNDYSAATYLKPLKRLRVDKHPAWQRLADLYGTTPYDRYLLRVLLFSYEALNTNDPTDTLAQEILVRAAYFAAGVPIPRDLLLATLHQSASHADDQRNLIGRLRGLLTTSNHTEELTLRSQDALARLVMLGLLELTTDGALLLHPFLRQCLQDLDLDTDAPIAVKKTVTHSVELLKQSGAPTALLAWQAHIQASVQLGDDADDITIPGPFSQHLKSQQDGSWEKVYYERALAISEQLMGDQHPDVAQVLDNLAIFAGYYGDYLSAEFYFERALAIRLAELGDYHLETARSFNNYGALLAAKGNYAKAQEQHNRALVIRRTVGGKRHPETAQSLNNLGELHYQCRELQKAQHYFEDALLIYQRNLGAYHPETARVLNNLGATFEAQEMYLKAQALYERALQIFQTVSGQIHGDVATVLSNLASLHECEGRYEQAKQLYEEVVAIRRQHFGAHHPATAMGLHNLAVLHTRLADYATAKLLLGEAIAALEATCPLGHPQLTASQEDLAAVEKRHRLSLRR